jgi:hypothetical protein
MRRIGIIPASSRQRFTNSSKWRFWTLASIRNTRTSTARSPVLLKGLQRVHVLQTLLTSTIQELGEAGQNHRFGYGRIDVLPALGYARDLGYFA